MRRSARLVSSLAVVSLLAACGSSSDTADDNDAVTTAAVATEGCEDPSTAAEKPAVSTPDALPTELEVTELRACETGDVAANGDTIILDYVGVRAEDGTEFDTSWGREPFTVVLGSGQVIAGWDQGLVGTHSGGRYQLDIPADLAYADQAPATSSSRVTR